MIRLSPTHSPYGHAYLFCTIKMHWRSKIHLQWVVQTGHAKWRGERMCSLDCARPKCILCSDASVWYGRLPPPPSHGSHHRQDEVVAEWKKVRHSWYTWRRIATARGTPWCRRAPTHCPPTRPPQHRAPSPVRSRPPLGARVVPPAPGVTRRRQLWAEQRRASFPGGIQDSLGPMWLRC
jgi:hypothetical protein